MREDDLMLTAIHEAGHARAYHRAGLPLRYVTVRPRGAGAVGLCKPWRPRRVDVYVMGVIACSGPIAQSIHEWSGLSERDRFGLEFDDVLTGAVLWGGGHDDREASAGLFDSPTVVQTLRDDLERNWDRVQAIAVRLVREGTVTGRDLWAMLA